MSVERAIRSQWLADPNLTQLVTGDHVFTDEAGAETTMPYVVLTREREKTATRTTKCEYSLTVIRFTVTTADFEEGLMIARAVEAAYNRQTLDWGPAEGSVLNIQWLESGRRRQDDGTWRLVLDYEVMVTKRRGR